jgi:hypothetical protein
MSTRFRHTVALVALAAACAFAQAQTPTRVGRISLAQGQVSISGEPGEETNAALVNWPVTSRNQVTTGRDARTEIKIGSTAVRLDADSALEVVELDDNLLRLHLHYGSATVRLRNADLLRGFEMATPQGIVQFQEPGRMRVDAGRRQDTTMVSVFDGVALLDGGGSRLVVRAGKRAEITRDDVRTGLALRDNFDEWAMLRDERDDRSESVRYVSSEMTGYEDLDQNGVWRDDREYGPLWSPRSMPIGWAPYRDGRWTFVQPWGWTWVDNAPWGYAPFHYGRWVMVNQRWCWAPGRNVSRVVWSPALVGWVGGSNWSLSFNTRGTHRAAPAQGWYPLAPRDTFAPSYRVDQDKLRHLNRHAGEARSDQRGERRHGGDNQRHGLTILPHEQFNQRGPVVVRGGPQAIVSATSMLAAPVAVAPMAPVVVRERERGADGRRDGRDGRDGRDARVAPDPRRFEREGAQVIPRGERVAIPATAGVQVNQAQPVAARPSSTVVTVPVSPGANLFHRDGRDGRAAGDDQRRPRMENPNHMPTPAPAMPPVQASPINTQAGVVAAQPAPQPQREERERRPRPLEAFQQQVQRQVQPTPVQQAPVQQQMQPQQQQRMPAPVQQQMQPQPQPQPQQQVQVARPAPAPVAAPAPAPARELDKDDPRRRGGRESKDGKANDR